MKYEVLGQVLTEVINFTNKHNIAININVFERSELDQESDEQSKNWAVFENDPGTYCFINTEENTVKYIGMSMSNTGGRIFNWLFKDDKIVKVTSESDPVLIVSFPGQHYMAPALESYLIEKYNPELNKLK